MRNCRAEKPQKKQQLFNWILNVVENKTDSLKLKQKYEIYIKITDFDSMFTVLRFIVYLQQQSFSVALFHENI